MRFFKKTVEKVLLELPIYETVDFEDLLTLRNQYKSDFEKFCIGRIYYNCGCYNSCNCPREQLAFKALRQETDSEFNARIEKETAEEKVRMQALEKQEKETLAKLEAKYKKGN